MQTKVVGIDFGIPRGQRPSSSSMQGWQILPLTRALGKEKAGGMLGAGGKLCVDAAEFLKVAQSVLGGLPCPLSVDLLGMLLWGSLSGQTFGTVVTLLLNCRFLELIWHFASFPGTLFSGFIQFKC